MDDALLGLPIDERIRLAEDLWDSVAADQGALPLTADQKSELDRRLDAFAIHKDRGRSAHVALSDIRRRL
jgi:putative addiction module component (TIGR02574 family)